MTFIVVFPLIALAWIVLAGLLTRAMRRLYPDGDPTGWGLVMVALLLVMVGLPVGLFRWVAGE